MNVEEKLVLELQENEQVMQVVSFDELKKEWQALKPHAKTKVSLCMRDTLSVMIPEKFFVLLKGAVVFIKKLHAMTLNLDERDKKTTNLIFKN